MFSPKLNASGRLSLTQRIVYGMPSMPHAFIASPLYVILPAYYAGHTHVTLTEIGMVAALGRVFDAALDPIIGFLSDRTRAAMGTRKIWAVGSMIFCALSATQLFQPPADAEIGYFALWSALLYIGFTMFEVPNSAWGAELSGDYAERSKIGAAKAMFNIAGSLASYLLPIGLYFLTQSTEINGTYLQYLSTAYVIIFPAFLLAAIAIVPNGPIVDVNRASFGAILTSLRRSGVLKRFFMITAFWGLGQGFLMSTIFIFLTDYLGLKSQFAFVMVALFIAEFVFLPVWTPILARIDRHRAWAICIGLAAFLSPAILLLPRGEAAFIPLIVFGSIRAFFSAPTNFLPGAVLGDVIDHDTLRTGRPKAGNFFALQLLMIKMTMALGGAGSFLILDFAGYRVGQLNSATANLGLIFAYLGMPLIMHLGAAAVAWEFPISRQKHKIIQQRLASRAQRLAVARQT
jgi:Na+/melibiose symporter-like transporter